MWRPAKRFHCTGQIFTCRRFCLMQEYEEEWYEEEKDNMKSKQMSKPYEVVALRAHMMYLDEKVFGMVYTV